MVYIDDRGPYLLELVGNADARRDPKGQAHYWADNLFVARLGQYAWVSSGDHIIHFCPHAGDGEPRPTRKGQY